MAPRSGSQFTPSSASCLDETVTHRPEKFMRPRNVMRGMLAAGMIVSVQLAVGQISFARQATPQAAPATGAQPPGRGAVDARVQQRTYTFADTNEQMPYALFVSSKVTRDKKTPLIVSLHGL